MWGDGMKICEYCGKEFKPKQERSKYCSRECSIRGFYQSKPKGATKTCTWCGKEFYAEHRGIKYCSPSCRQKAADKQQDESNKRRKKAEHKPKACLHCGKEFIPKDKRQKYCSKECSIIHNRLIYQSQAEERKKAREEMKKAKAEMKKKEPKKPTYSYKKNEGIEEIQPKPIAKLSPASQRWAKMSWADLTKELLYYGIKYKDAQLMAESNTLPEDFGLKRKKAKQ